MSVQKLKTHFPLILLLAVILPVLHPLSATAHGNWQVYTSGGPVRDIAFSGDSIWCATDGGVVRWGSRTLTSEIYHLDAGLPGIRMNAVAADHAGRVWVSVTGYGLACFDGHSWKRFGPEQGLAPKNLGNIAVDEQNRVYVCAGLEGIYRFDGNYWYKITAGLQLQNWSFWKLAALPDGVIWAIVDNGVAYCNGTEWKVFTPEDGFPTANAVAATSDGSVWFATDTGVHRYSRGAWKIYTARDGLATDTVTDLAVDEKGVIWALCSDAWINKGGISRLDGETWTTVRRPEDWGRFERDMFGVRNGVAWIGMERNGLARCGESGWDAVYPEGYPPENGARVFAEGKDGAIWAAGANLARYTKGKWERLGPCQGLHVMTTDRSGRLLYGIDNFGIYRLEENTWESQVMLGEFRGALLHALAVDVDSTVWVGTTETSGKGGLFRYREQEKTWERVTDPESGTQDGVYALAFGADGSLWAATRYTLSRYARGTWKRYSAEDEPFLANSIRSLAAAPDGAVYMSSRAGTAVFRDEKFEVLSPMEFPFLAPDDQGGLWAAQQRTNPPQYYNGRTWSPLPIPSGEMKVTPYAIYYDSRGALWVGTSSYGIYRYDPGIQVRAESGKSLPVEIRIIGNYPNPFNPATTIGFTLPAPSAATLTVYDSAGRKVRELMSGCYAAGTHQVVWDGKSEGGRDVSSGVYFVLLRAGRSVASHRMLLLK